jgi:DNA-binding MarR family transcriptional regulator
MLLCCTAMTLGGAQVSEVRQLQRLVQEFVRSFGLLITKQTPCGHPVSPSHAHALMILLEREGDSTTQSDLGVHLGIDKSNVARLCARMHEEGHVLQEVSAEDARGRRLSLTVKGRRMAEQLKGASLARFQRVLHGVPPAKRRQLLDSLQLLNASIALLAPVQP